MVATTAPAGVQPIALADFGFWKHLNGWVLRCFLSVTPDLYGVKIPLSPTTNPRLLLVTYLITDLITITLDLINIPDNYYARPDKHT